MNVWFDKGESNDMCLLAYWHLYIFVLVYHVSYAGQCHALNLWIIFVQKYFWFFFCFRGKKKDVKKKKPSLTGDAGGECVSYPILFFLTLSGVWWHVTKHELVEGTSMFDKMCRSRRTSFGNIKVWDLSAFLCHNVTSNDKLYISSTKHVHHTWISVVLVLNLGCGYASMKPSLSAGTQCRISLYHHICTYILTL